MRKHPILLPILVFLFLLAFTACGGNESTESGASSEENMNTTASPSAAGDGTPPTGNEASPPKNEPVTRIYQSENGPVEVPAHPQRVVVLASFAGNVMALDVPLVGVDQWSKMNPRFRQRLEGVAEVTDEDLEKLIELGPDLIIGLSNTKNLDRLRQIAPTVTYTYGKLDYLTQHLEIGKLLNKEAEAQAWIEDFRRRARAGRRGHPCQNRPGRHRFRDRKFQQRAVRLRRQLGARH